MAATPSASPTPANRNVRPRSRSTLPGLIIGLAVVTILYFGKPVLMPLALAGLFSFLLSPLVNSLHRLRLPRALAVVLVTLSVFSLLGVLGWVIGRELSSLAASLPNYKDNIRSRIISFHQSGRGGVMDQIKEIKTTIEETNAEAEAEAEAEAKAKAGVETGTGADKGKPALPEGTEASTPVPPPPPESPAPPPAPAEPEPTQKKSGGEKPAPPAEAERSPNWMNGMLGNAGEALATVATVIVFVIFMLLRQQELRNRLMRLAGFRHVTIVTRAMDETGERVGRYLLMQATINGLYGVVLATGLYFIGMPYVVLWGVLAALFRFIPYVGPIVVAILPSAVSLAVFPDWQQPLMVMGLIAVLELVTNMILEPVLYGHSVGVSEFALLIAIVFWTWIWGGIGLVMATPLTVCFVVMARHVPALEWVEILMGDNPKVKPYMVLYQRLLAGDDSEAEDFLTAELKKKTRIEVLDETILPAIALAKRESSQDRLTDAEEKEIHDSILQVMTEAMPPTDADAETGNRNGDGDGDGDGIAEAPVGKVPVAPRPLLLGWPLDDSADDTALRCLALHLPSGLDFEIVPGQRLTAELHADIEARQPTALLISATPPGSHETARLHLRRIRRQFPKLRVFIGRWGVPDDLVKADPLLEAGASAVYTRLSEAETALVSLLRETAAIDTPPEAGTVTGP
jgi:predicted PurR-regulated permease PerM